ncbi:MAG TPA: phospho-N-acetylmuramoyl-pentapeptide-transferase [Acidimicrobiia bacterium]|nr:phospho-N-acetylmuramoyl-pentapeptide-transferase [Acidimicrobiia bacterium]
MTQILVAAMSAFAFTILVTPVAIRVLRSHSIGQFIQEDVRGHMHKRGTPTMGGIVIIVGALLGYVGAHFRFFTLGEGVDMTMHAFAPEGWLAVLVLVGMGFIGFLDDFVKYARKGNQGLSKRWKFIGQLAVAVAFAWGAGLIGVSTELSFLRPLGIDLGPILYFVLVLVMLTAAANAVNLTDGLDGLVAGSISLVFGAYVLIAFWQFRNVALYFMDVNGALDLARFSAAVVGAALGFLWWNAPPAQIFMGDTGSQALGGALAALALLTNTQLLLLLLGGLYVIETMSVIGQVFAFRVFGRRILRMAPIHHHFELRGWPETIVIIRFWILAGIMVALGVGLFYADFLSLSAAGTP